MSSIILDSVPVASEQPAAIWQRDGIRPSLVRKSAPIFTAVTSKPNVRIVISCLDDIVTARRAGRLLAGQMGLSESRVALVLTAISELARNIIRYAKYGEITLSRSNYGSGEVISVVASDQGPGIKDVSMIIDRAALGADSGGLGLCGLKQCMDRFSIVSQPGLGTQVTCEVRPN